MAGGMTFHFFIRAVRIDTQQSRRAVVDARKTITS
ncbi:hypothetical protein T07_2238 [Trichinella nelsoni]|uniref:Uncharacterized protein n=1 Tax=Trichinella nelsoni TaxID=6336 RepID=A0A0V0RBY3_9BILA|nr:hypothetical protein T07_2238 [Trichinella nelsoni]